MSAAASAAGYLYASGKLTRPEREERNTRLVALKDREYGKACPYCSERFSLDLFEFHLFIAHKSAEAKP